MLEQLGLLVCSERDWGGRWGEYARIRFWEVGERKEQETACRTDVGLCADTTYAILTSRMQRRREGKEDEMKVPVL